MRPSTRAGVVVLGVVSMAGCGEPEPQPPADFSGTEVVVPPVSLPSEPGRFAPALTRLEPSSPVSGRYLSDARACGECHPDALAQWSSSAHALASFSNPIYRTAVERFRDEVSPEASRFCAGCHDIALLVDGAMADGAISPGDPRGHAGIGCRLCHGVQDARRDGNGSYTLARAPIPIPADGDDASLRRHRRAAATGELGADLCISCHRSFLGPETGNPEHLSGQDEATAWQDSPYAGSGAARIDAPIEPRDCLDCHMDREAAPLGDVAAAGGRIASHRFAGAHTWLAAMTGDTEQLVRTREMLAGAVTIDVAAARGPDGWTLPADGAPVPPGERVEVDVVIRNRGVGHRFPAGVRDAQDTWIEVVVRTADGRIVGRSGTAHADEPGDREAHVLRTLVAGEDGVPLFERQTHRFRAPVADTTIAPRDAVAVRYALEVPDELSAEQLPLRVRARIRHRSRNLRLQARACESARSERGRAFAEAADQHRGVGLDPCAPQPVTTLAESVVDLGAGAPRPDPATRWQRLYEHGMALTHAVQERVGEARPSLHAALDAAGGQGTEAERRRAAVLVQLGRVAGAQGRTREALEWLDRAAALRPGHPAIARARAAALMRVWRWAGAAASLKRLTGQVPENGDAWVARAVTLGSLGRSRAALEAARAGLALRPRDGDLLRVQALSVRDLLGGHPLARRALDAYDRHRAPDRAVDVRVACARSSAACARERQPVHVHVLR